MEASTQNNVCSTQQSLIICEKKERNINPKLRRNAEMSDEYINNRAKKEAVDQYQNSPFRALTAAAVVAFPVVDSVTIGALQDGVNNKAKATLGAAKNWGIVIGLAAIANKAANAVINRIPSLKEFKDEHPIATGVGVLAASVAGAYHTIEPVSNLISKAFETERGANIKQGVKAFIKKTPLNSEGFKNFIDKYVFKPAENLVNTEKKQKIFGYGALALLGGALAKEVFDASSANKKQQYVKNKLEMKRLKSQLEIAKNTSVKKSEIVIINTEA